MTIVEGMLVRLGNLTQPVLCVDPVQEMLDVAEANKMENIETLCETAEEFTKRQIKYDKILIKGTVHHFPAENIENIFTGIYNQLNEGGILLIEKLSGNKVNFLKLYVQLIFFVQNAGIPFFKRGKEVQLEVHQGLTEKLVGIFESLKFKKVEKFAIECHTSKTKDEAIAHIKNRSASSWATLTEDEIEDGVKDVQENFGDIIEYITEMEIIIATK